MMIFNNSEFGQVRTVTIDGEIWFVGKDIAESLGYTNTRKALSDHVHDDDKGVTNCDTLGGTQQMTIINESGMYALIFGSRLASAMRFKHWVTSEVLPSIRKTGRYSAVSEQIPYDKYLEAAKLISECKKSDRKLIIGILNNGGFNIPVVDVVAVSKSSVEQAEFTEDFVKFMNDNGYSYKRFSEVSGLAKSCIHNYATGKTIADEKNMKILEEHGFRKPIEEQVVEEEGENVATKQMSEYEKKVRIAMTEKGIRTFSELAKRLGVSVSYISEIVNYDRPATELRKRFNEYLGIDGDE